MSAPFPWAAIIMFMGGGQGFLLFTVLWPRVRGRAGANRWLAVLMLLTAIRLTAIGLDRIGATDGSWDWTLPLIATYSPLLYLYCRSLLVPGSLGKRIDLYHFAPAILWAAWRAAAALFSEARPAAPPDSGLRFASVLPDLFWLAQTTVYLCLIGLLLRRHSSKSTGELSDINAVRLAWLRTLTGAFAFLCVLVAIFLAGSALGVSFGRPSNTVLYISIALIVYVWGWFGLRQPLVFKDPEMETRETGTSGPRLPPQKTAEALERLTRTMETQLPHLDPGLTLQGLARAAELPSYQLTALLNDGLGQTFFEFINRRRVEEAKTRLADPSLAHLKILSIALDCGFASKSAFNRVFLDLAGMTPSEYRKGRRRSNGADRTNDPAGPAGGPDSGSKKS